MDAEARVGRDLMSDAGEICCFDTAWSRRGRVHLDYRTSIFFLRCLSLNLVWNFSDRSVSNLLSYNDSRLISS